jgi:hypothetical protein
MGIGTDQLGQNRVQIYRLNTIKQVAGPGKRFYKSLEFRLVGHTFSETSLQTQCGHEDPKLKAPRVHNNVIMLPAENQLCGFACSLSLKQLLHDVKLTTSDHMWPHSNGYPLKHSHLCCQLSQVPNCLFFSFPR